MTGVHQPTCPHCGREWHGLAITERMQQMRHAQYFDIGYRYGHDHSAVLCAGSTFVGPMPEERSIHSGFDVHATWRDLVGTVDRDEPPKGTATSRPVAVGLDGGLDTATWCCAVCGSSAEFAVTQDDPNAFALALRDFARHVAVDHESIFEQRKHDPVDLAAQFGIPERGVLRDRAHNVIGSFAPGGTVFHSPATGRDLATFGPADTLDS